MIFQDLDYYKIVVDNNISVYNSLTCPKEKEIYLRNIISRTYYTCYLHCRDKLIDADKIDTHGLDSDTSHTKVIEELPKGIKQQLKQLKIFRIKADYNNNSLSLPLQGKRGRGSLTFASPEHFMSTLTTILSYECT